MNKRQRKKLHQKIKNNKAKCHCPIDHIEGVNYRDYKDERWVHYYYEVCALCGKEYHGYRG